MKSSNLKVNRRTFIWLPCDGESPGVTYEMNADENRGLEKWFSFKLKIKERIIIAF